MYDTEEHIVDLRLQGKAALVTGSSSGIGEAIALALAQEGVAVVVHGRKQGEAERVAQAVRQSGGRSSVALGELSADEGAADVTRSALGAFGGIDIVVNNAGAYAQDDWSAPSARDWLALYDQNTVSMVRVIGHLIGPLTSRGWGRFIQVASGVATAPGANAAAYAASKAAVLNLSVSLSKALAGTGITSNSISPGVIFTPAVAWFMNDVAAKQGWSGPPEAIERNFLAMFGPVPPSGRLGRVEEVARLVTFLASPCADYINGADLRVDGGFLPTVH